MVQLMFRLKSFLHADEQFIRLAGEGLLYNVSSCVHQDCKTYVRDR